MATDTTFPNADENEQARALTMKCIGQFGRCIWLTIHTVNGDPNRIVSEWELLGSNICDFLEWADEHQK